ncbi:hypothetical protein Agub_g2778, partial [Astrephomene gubernaculifera]
MRPLDDVLAAPGALVLVICIFAPLFTPFIRKHVRPVVLDLVYKHCGMVASLQQRLRNPLLDVLVKITAFTVSVEFYLLAIPPIMWLGGPSGGSAAMAICLCMAVSTYMTCVLKDLLSCPRPGPATAAAAAASAEKKNGKADKRLPAAADATAAGTAAGPGANVAGSGVEVLEAAYRGEIEMGAPSMHTWCALVLPAYSAVVAAQMGLLGGPTATTTITTTTSSN